MKKVSNKLYKARKIMDYTGVVFLVLLLLFIWQLYRGPVAVPFLKPYIIKALNHDDSEYQVTVDAVNLELVRSIQPIKIIANNVVYKKNDGTFIINAPKTSVSFSIRALLRGVIAPSSVEISAPSVYLFTTYGIGKNNRDEVNRKKLEYYFDAFEDFVERFNSEDRAYPESYINDISVKNAELEFHEVDLGRKWVFSDLNYTFERNFTNIETDFNALLKLRDRISTVGIDAEYRPGAAKLALRFYFSDLVPADVVDTFLEKQFSENLYGVNLPVSGKVDALIDFEDVLRNKDDIVKSLDTAVENIDFQFEGGQGNIMFSDNEDFRYNVSSFLLEGNVDGGVDKVNIKDADFDLGGQKMKLGLQITGMKKFFFENSLRDLKISASADVEKLAFDDLNKYWPRYIAEDAWLWVKDSIYGGEIRDASFRFDFDYDAGAKGLRFSNLDGRGTIVDSNLNYLKGMPDIRNMYGTAYFNSDSIKIDVDKGVSDGVILTGGSVLLYDLDKYDNFADINLETTSSIADALKLIDNPPLGYTSEMGMDADAIHGEAETSLGLKFELKNDLEPEEVRVNVKSVLTDVSIPGIVKGKDVRAETLNLVVDNNGMSVIGDAQLDGIPLHLVWDENFLSKDYKSKYKISFRFDDAVKKKLGIDIGVLNPPYIEGYANVDAEITKYDNDRFDIDVIAALADATIDYSFLGFRKPLKQQAAIKAKLNFAGDRLTAIPSFSLSKSDFKLNGSITLDKDGEVKVVDISSIKGPKTSAKAKIEIAYKPKKKVKINISGNSYDLTELFVRDEEVMRRKAALRKTQKQAKDDDEDYLEKVTDTDIYIAVNSLWTNPEVPITNFAGSAMLRNGTGVSEAHLVGNYGTSRNVRLKADYVPKPNGEFFLSIDSNNAGSTLKVLRIYENMRGGNLKIEARRTREKQFIGHASIRDFSIYNTPVIAKLLTMASFTGMVNLLTGEGMAFSHFDAPFEYKNRTLFVNEGKAFGNVMGITGSGAYNRATEVLDVKGVIAPAYSINTFIGKLPLVGSLLAGKDGTVFAANYTITGSISDPKISINPLSALSPSSLKDLFSNLFGGGNDKRR